MVAGTIAATMAKAPRSKPAAAPKPDPLAESINRLAGEIGLLREVIDEVREEFTWLTRNGLPVQPVEHIILQKLPLNPCDPHWNEKVQIDHFTVPGDTYGPAFDSARLDQIAEDLKASFEAVAQGQLEIVLTALDGVRGEIVAALKRRNSSNTPAAQPVVDPLPVSQPKEESTPAPPATVDPIV